MMKQYKKKLTRKLSLPDIANATLKKKKQKHINFLISIIYTNMKYFELTVCNTGLDCVHYKGFNWSLLGPKLKK